MLLKILDPNLYRVSLITQSLGIFKKKVAGMTLLPFAAIFRRQKNKWSQNDSKSPNSARNAKKKFGGG